MTIGGYFELELPQVNQYHGQAINLNSGRHSLEYILRLRSYTKIWIPYYTCEVVLQPIKKLGIDYGFYHIDEMLEPIFDYDSLADNEAFLYTNYFGIKDHYIRSLPAKCNIIIDNSMAFFAKPIPGFDTFYSARKFFGVPDGAYLYTYEGSRLDMDLPQSTSYQRCAHLLKRIDLGAEQGYADFKANDAALSDQEIKTMSRLTERILSSIDYEYIESRRFENFSFFNLHLGQYNLLSEDLCKAIDGVPLVYPFVVEKPGLREILISNRIYVAQYWPYLACEPGNGSMEQLLTEQLIALPIDHRITQNSLVTILTIVNDWINHNVG